MGLNILMLNQNKTKSVILDLWPSLLSIVVSSALLYNKITVITWSDKTFFSDHYINHQGGYSFWCWCSVLCLFFPLLWLYLRPYRIRKVEYKNAVVYSAIMLAIFAGFLMVKMDSVI